MHEKLIICVCDERFYEEIQKYDKTYYIKHQNKEIIDNTLERI